MKPEPSEAKKKKQSIKTGFNFTLQRVSNKWRNSNCKKKLSKRHFDVSAKGFTLICYPQWGGGGVCGEKFVKEQRDKSLLSLRAKNSDGYLLHCCV